MKLYTVTFSYEETANIPYICAGSPEEAVEGAKLLSKGRVKGARDFTATETHDDAVTTTQTLN